MIAKAFKNFFCYVNKGLNTNGMEWTEVLCAFRFPYIGRQAVRLCPLHLVSASYVLHNLSLQ